VILSLSLSIFIPGGAHAQQEEVPVEKAGDSSKASEKPDVQAKDEEDDAVPTEAQQRELQATEDPLAASQARREADRAEDKADVEERTTGFDLYGSLRVRYREQQGDSSWQDGGSRAGINFDWQFREGAYFFTRYEFGFNLLTGIENLGSGKEGSEDFEDSIFTRLRHVGLDIPAFTAVVGKNWSTYYEVSGLTDRFMSTGGSASGTYNAQTDGGATGPGRADNVIQSKLSTDFLPHKYFEPFDLNVQLQKGNPIPFGGGAEYEEGFGASAILTTQNNFTIALAYNHANVDLKKNPSLRDIGIKGDARAVIIGTRGFGDRWYAGLIVARLENHETTDEGIYFDGWGSELYAQYQFLDRWWLVGGYNILDPDSGQDRAGDYRVRYAVAEMRFTFKDFSRMVFANIRFDDSRNADGTSGGNVYTIGVRWDLDKIGWHYSSLKN
jgi:hypothetical protein